MDLFVVVFVDFDFVFDLECEVVLVVEVEVEVDLSKVTFFKLDLIYKNSTILYIS